MTAWTDAKVAALRLDKDASERRVSVERGLYLRLRRGLSVAGATPLVSKRWEFRAKVGKRARWLALGEYGAPPAISLAVARERAAALRGQADKARKGEGDHPAIAARAERSKALTEPTLKEVATEWLRFAELRESTKGLHRGNLEGDVYPRIGDARIKHLTAQHFRDCIDAAVRRGKRGQAAQVYKSLRTLVNFALKSRGYLDTDPMANVANPKPYNPRKVTPRAATDGELRPFLALLGESGISPAVRLGVQLQLLTGARPGEVRGATWHEIHEDRAVWRIPADRVKTGKAFEVHLSPAALAVLEEARQIPSPNDREDGAPARAAKKKYIFPGIGGGMVSKVATARALSRLSAQLAKKRIEPLRPHDLRRTFRTMLARLGVAPHIAERCINHADGSPLDAVYNAHDYRPQMIEAWDRAGAHIEAIRKGAAEIIPLAAARAA